MHCMQGLYSAPTAARICRNRPPSLISSSIPFVPLFMQSFHSSHHFRAIIAFFHQGLLYMCSTARFIASRGYTLHQQLLESAEIVPPSLVSSYIPFVPLFMQSFHSSHQFREIVAFFHQGLLYMCSTARCIASRGYTLHQQLLESAEIVPPSLISSYIPFVLLFMQSFHSSHQFREIVAFFHQGLLYMCSTARCIASRGYTLHQQLLESAENVPPSLISSYIPFVSLFMQSFHSSHHFRAIVAFFIRA
jgi:hypothetical protein